MAVVLSLVGPHGSQIKGDSKVPGYEGCIDVLSWSWGSSFNPENLRDVTITKSYDSASVLLLNQIEFDNSFDGTLYVLDTSNPTNTVVVCSVELHSITVQEIDTAGGPELPEEKITLRYAYLVFWNADKSIGATFSTQSPPSG